MVTSRIAALVPTRERVIACAKSAIGLFATSARGWVLRSSPGTPLPCEPTPRDSRRCRQREIVDVGLLFLRVAVDPGQHFLVPHLGVLRLEDPVVLVGELQE